MYYGYENKQTGERIMDSELDDKIEEELNELYPMVDICGSQFEAGTILREISPVTFRCIVADSEEWEESKSFDTIEKFDAWLEGED